MNRRAWLGLVPLTLLGCAAEPSNRTARLLGPEDGWAACRLELRDVHSQDGGVDVVLDGRGSCEVQRVDAERRAQRYQLGIGSERATSIFRQAIADDLLGLEALERDDAAPTRITLVGPDAQREVRAPDPEVERFLRVRDALRELAAAAEDPWWTGAYDPVWHPLEGAEVSVLLHAGPPNPSWNLAADALAPLLDRLAELEPATPVARPALGYRGFRLRFRGGGPGANVEVYRGTVLIQQRNGDSETLEDARGLEVWLRTRAAERGVEVPE